MESVANKVEAQPEAMQCSKGEQCGLKKGPGMGERLRIESK